MAVDSSSSDGARAGGAEGLVSEAPTRQFAVLGGGEACASCGAPLSSDQRYCVACGERRGRPRFPVADLATPAPPPPDPVVAPPARAVTWSGGMTLVTGIATLLLAMGVGVLIGRTGQSSPQRAAAAPSVITVNGGGGAAPATPASTSSSAGRGTKKAKPVKGLPSKKVVVKAQQQASKVLGGTNLPPPTVKVGQGGAGPGFQGGKFTGNFFGQ